MCLLKERDPAAADRDDLADLIVGDSRAMRVAMERLRRVARTSLSVLLLGESGTGKGVWARAIHRLSRRRAAPFVQVNSAALAESVLESELFGHEKGAFTGAASQRQGRFELADGGTLFLDEIGEISPSFQAKLLRVLQEREFERVGGTTTIRVDVRIIAATNCDLEAAVAAGRFRSDLYFRLNTVPISLPPLRHRRDDIPAFALRALDQFNRDNGTQFAFSPKAIAVMRGCAFPGNIRELENCVRRTAILAHSPIIEASDFACRGEGCTTQLMIRSTALNEPAPYGRRSAGTSREPPRLPLADSEVRDRPGLGRKPGRHRVVDADRLVEALRRVGWSQAKAGRLLGVTSRQVRYALKRHGIKIQKI
ncbi:sigma 54-interacting transcriptional regulator [Rhodopseudomonas sp. B29]|uniref:sigma 54-interacting transcriptional regulator n=1 Tax=Rhodopseudomonas sp. B29 TaxID=95607 RepID=UPI00034C5ACD|nr:sigma 54-interacting transcriptional regulator [Rhodopseudomonas sp. B29]